MAIIQVKAAIAAEHQPVEVVKAKYEHYKITNDYLFKIVTWEKTALHVAAKISILAFPIIFIITLLLDFISYRLYENKEVKEIALAGQTEKKAEVKAEGKPEIEALIPLAKPDQVEEKPEVKAVAKVEGNPKIEAHVPSAKPDQVEERPEVKAEAKDEGKPKIEALVPIAIPDQVEKKAEVKAIAKIEALVPVAKPDQVEKELTIAIRRCDLKDWQPRTESVLDMRLASFNDEAKENKLIGKISAEMGKKLTEVYTQGSYISQEGYRALLKNSPDVRILNLSFAHKTGDTALGVIAQFQQLEELNLNFASNEADIEDFGIMMRSDPNTTEYITDDGVEAILKNCKKLSKLDLSWTKVKKKTLELIADLKNITVLSVRDCWGNDLKAAIQELSRVRPDLKIIHKDSELDANREFIRLEKAVKGRFSLKVPTANGGYSLQLKPTATDIEKSLVAPSVFFDGSGL